ncbi:MAG: hypothetical protein M1465_00430 [Candidatus Marsarchaeota archaeon]|nr:hypothetical protein [Candidatus Marsarchaeota archaeon]
MGKNVNNDSSYLFIAVIILLAMALAVLSIGFYQSQHSTVTTTTTITKAVGSASLYVKITAPEYVVEEFRLTFFGPSTEESGYFRLGPRIYNLTATGVNGEYAVSGPITLNSTTKPNSTVIVPDNSSSIFFSGLVPDSNYTITINGSESPYCFPGLLCPMFILKLFRTYTVHTGPANSTTNITINVIPEPQSSNSTSTSCSVNLPVVVNESSYVKCYDGSRLLNFVLSHVNNNATVTGFVYPYLISINKSIKPYKEVLHYGQEASFFCSGYVAYLNSANYTNQYAVFKVTRIHPILCPAA